MNIERWDEHRHITTAMDDLVSSMDDSSQMKKVVSHVCSSGGKKIRPIILMLSTQICGTDPSKSINAALAIELMHSASLIHDDLLDGGLIRRGIPAAHEKFGYAAALLCGDFLISKSIKLIAPYGNDAICDFGKAGMHMAEGETLDIKSNDESIRDEDYFECIKKKTASLFGASAAIGAHIAGADRDTVAICRSYGEYIGTAYQIVDDILEYLEELDDKRSTYEAITLPHIYERTMGHEKALERSIEQVERYVKLTKESIATFKPCDAADKLLMITDHITVDMLPQDRS